MEISDKYLQNTAERLNKMETGHALDLDTIADKEKKEKFVEAVKWFIDQGNGDFEFSNDYRYVRRIYAF